MAQQKNHPKDIVGSLTVTCTVSSSVGVVQAMDGTRYVVIANAAGPGDNVSSEIASAPNSGMTRETASEENGAKLIPKDHTRKNRPNK